MKISTVLFASAMAAAVSALAADGAFAAAASYNLNARDPNAANACVANGGNVVTDASGNKVCVMQPACAASSVPVPYVLDPHDPYAVQTCSAACGTVSVDKNGQKSCVKSASTREPTN